jgi:transcriptional regulator with XRE-family HTH domain
MEVSIMADLDGLGKRLKQLREQKDMSMDMVVYAIKDRYNIEISKGHISRWENGKNYPSLHLAAYLCAFYDVSLDYLIGNTDVKTPTRILTKERRQQDGKS